MFAPKVCMRINFLPTHTRDCHKKRFRPDILHYWYDVDVTSYVLGYIDTTGEAMAETCLILKTFK